MIMEWKAGGWHAYVSVFILMLGILCQLWIGIYSLGSAGYPSTRPPPAARGDLSSDLSHQVPTCESALRYFTRCSVSATSRKHCSLHLVYLALRSLAWSSLGWCRTWPGDAEGRLGHCSHLSSLLWLLRITNLLWQPSHLVRLNRKEVELHLPPFQDVPLISCVGWLVGVEVGWLAGTLPFLSFFFFFL